MFRSISNLIICLLFFGGNFVIHGQQKIIVFENVNIIPMDREIILYNQRVIVDGNIISKIEPASSKLEEDADIVIKAEGKYLIPGLSEMHYHLQNNFENEFKLLIANGITTVRNMAEFEGQDQIAVREQAGRPEILAPFYVTTGPYLKANDLRTEEEVIKVVKKHRERNYDFLKIADNLPKHIYIKLLEETDKYKIPIVGHGQRKLPLEYSLRMKSIAHIEEFMNIFTEQQKEDTIYLQKAAREIKTSGLYVSPTLGVFEMIGKYADDEKFERLKRKDEIKYLPEKYAAYCMSDSIHYRTNSWFTAPESLIRLKKELEWQKKFSNILVQEKVPLLSGSDTYGLFLPGFSLHRELELINESGISNYETLKTSTVSPARYLNTISMRGTINEGKFADLVLLRKNPLSDIKNTKTIEGVMLKGKWLDRKNLDAMLMEVELSVSQGKEEE